MTDQLALETPTGVVDWTDIFCGAGGSSLGIEFVPGMIVTQALNHWDLAVEAHNANFPMADHDVHDVELVPATRFRRTRCLWASPDCTHHAYCRGPKSHDPEALRSRSTFQDIVRFTEHHRYDAVVVENVVEARLWCDVRGHGKCSCGSTFNAWFKSMTNLGYEGKVVYFNSQFALPTPQSRDRMYIVFWRKGLRAPNLDFQPLSWCSECETVVHGVQTWKKPSPGSLRTQPGLFEWGRYGQQYLYTCSACHRPVAPAVVGARTIIDWTLPAQKIGERAKPLADKTRQRIKTGLERLATLDPVTVQVGGNLFERPGYARVWSIDDPLRTVTGTRSMGLVVPAAQYAPARVLDEPTHTIPGSERLGLVVRVGGQNGHGRSLEEPTQTVIGSDRQVGLVVPNMEHNTPRVTEEPIGAVTSGNRHMLVQVNRGASNGRDSRSAQTLDEPTRTIAGHGELALVEMRNHGRVEPIEKPAATVAANGNHHGVLVYNGVPGFVRTLEDAAGTVTGRDKQALLVPPAERIVVVSDDDVDACTFRMLQWHELLKAQQMHAHADGRAYSLTARRRDKRGNMRDLSNEQKVKMIGNAVSSPVSALLASAIGEILAEAA